MNLIFDIGGIIIDDSQVPRQKFTGLSDDMFREFDQDIYHNPKWVEVNLGHVPYQEYFYEMAQKFPKWRDICVRIAEPASSQYIVPILSKNLDYILKIKNSDKYKVYLLSNIADATYYYLYDVIKQFDGGAYSFIEHLRKPDQKFYQILLGRYNLLPEDCLFFDDRQINLDAAAELGIKTVLFRSLDDLQAQNLD